MFLLSYPSPLFLVASFFPWGQQGVCEPLWLQSGTQRQILSINCTALLWKVGSLACLGYQVQNLLCYKSGFITACCKTSVLLWGKKKRKKRDLRDEKCNFYHVWWQPLDCVNLQPVPNCNSVRFFFLSSPVFKNILLFESLRFRFVESFFDSL